MLLKSGHRLLFDKILNVCSPIDDSFYIVVHARWGMLVPSSTVLTLTMEDSNCDRKEMPICIISYRAWTFWVKLMKTSIEIIICIDLPREVGSYDH